MAYPPWIALFSAAVVAAGLALLNVWGGPGFDHLDDSLDILGVSVEQQGWPRKAMHLATITVAVLAGILLILSFFRSYLEMQQDRKGHAPGSTVFMWLNAAANFLFWCSVVILLLASWACVVTASTSFAIYRGTDVAESMINDKLLLARDKIGVARQFVRDFEADNSNRLDIKNWAKVEALKAAIGERDEDCPFYCFDLGKLKFLKNKKCICSPAMLQDSRPPAKKALDDLVLANVAYIITFFGCTWLMMNVVGQFSHTKADRRWAQRMDNVVHKNAEGVLYAA